MNLYDDFKINEYQPIYGWDGTDIGVFFQIILEINKARGSSFEENSYYLLSKAYTYGMICGKREERARRKRGHKIGSI